MTKTRCRHRRTLGGAAGWSVALRLETLETRTLLSASSMADELIAQPLSVSPLATSVSASPRGFTPTQIRQAYGFNQISFNGGTVAGDGRGQTIAIVAAYDHPTIASDLQVFSRTFGIADPPSFVKVNQYGGTQMPAFNALWAEEIALDVQWAHAMAPAANILLVEANSGSLGDLLAAVDTARHTPGVSVVSMSWGIGEFAGQGVYDQYFTTPSGHAPVTFVAAAGDGGAQAVWPAISSNVIAVGGTALRASTTTYISESGWNKGGGGYSTIVARPDYQQSVQGSGFRTSPDVSYVANPSTGVSIYNTALSKWGGWFRIGGTSVGAPQWAALVAIVDQGRALNGQPLLGDGHAELYNLSSTSFHDVVTGNNGHRTNPGYDLVTGRGTPIASEIVRGLVAARAVPVAPTPAPPPAPAPVAATTPGGFQLVYQNRRWMLVPVAPNAIGNDEAESFVFQLFIGQTREPQDARAERAASFTETLVLGEKAIVPRPIDETVVVRSTTPSSRGAIGKGTWLRADDAHGWSTRGYDQVDCNAHFTFVPGSTRVARDVDHIRSSGPILDTSQTLEQVPSIDSVERLSDDVPMDPICADQCLELDTSSLDGVLAWLPDRFERWDADIAMIAVAIAALASHGTRETTPETPLRIARWRSQRLIRR